jgi:hypothetical protein
MASNSTNLNKTKPCFHQPAAPTPNKREPKQKTLPGKSAYNCKSAHNRIPTPMGLDHRSINIAFARATQPPGRMKAADAALTEAAAFVLSSVFSVLHDANY